MASVLNAQSSGPWRQIRACVAWLQQQQPLIIDLSGRLFANDTHSAFTEVINKQVFTGLHGLHGWKVSNTHANCFLSAIHLCSFPVVSNLFLSVRLCPVKWYRSFGRCWCCLAEERPALAQLGTAGILPNQCAGPDNSVSGRAKPCSPRLPVP